MFCPSLDTIAEGVADAGYVHRLAVDQAWLVTEAGGGVQRGAFERRVVAGTFDDLRVLYPALAGYRVAHRAGTFDAAVQGPARIGWRLLADGLVLGNGRGLSGAAGSLGVGQRAGFGLGGLPLLLGSCLLFGLLALLLFPGQLLLAFLFPLEFLLTLFRQPLLLFLL